MANPNIVQVTSILGVTAVQNVAATATAIVSNSAGSGSVYKIDSLIVSNNDTASHTLTIDVFRSSVAYPITYQVPINASSVFDALSKYVFLNEGDALRLTADTANKLTAVASYTVIA